jgi:hypothetical protein
MYPISKSDARKATIAYANIFHYSLTREELARWFLFYPVGKILQNKHRKPVQQTEKWAIACRAGRWLSLVPTIQLVGVTGGLAMNNAGAEDDIDLFCIVADGTLWISRMMATILMDILRLRRHPNETSVSNKICLNMFMTAGATDLKPTDRDCFSAHEVLQMVPIFVRGNIYKTFLHANTWVKYFLPNAWRERNNQFSISNIQIKKTNFIFYLLEPFVKYFQLRYMQKHRTNERISDTELRFHPKDARVWIKRKFKSRLSKFHIPLDKVFYPG